MHHFLYSKKIVTSVKAFTLLETLASIAIVTTVILGPLTVAINSAAFSRQTKDVMVATSLAEESLELLHHQYDSLLVRCQAGISPCTSSDLLSGTIEETNSSKAAWRIFKQRLGSTDNSHCFSSLHKGCSFDFIFFSGATTTPIMYNADDSTKNDSCPYLSLTKSSDKRNYTCSEISSHSLGIFLSKVYTRSVFVESSPTLGEGVDPINSQYNDDLRITSRVTFRRPNGQVRTIELIDFLHAK